MMTGKIKKYLLRNKFWLILILLTIVSHFQWFIPWSILQSGDWHFRFDEPVKELYKSWNSWLAFEGLGAPNIQIFNFPIRGVLWSGLVNLGLSYDLAVKATLLMPIACTPLIAFYVGKKINNNELASFVAALTYSTTTYFLLLQTRHLFIAIVYALLPLLFYLTKKVLDNNSLRSWLLLTLFLELGVVYEFRIVTIVFLLLMVYVLYRLFTKDTLKLKIYVKNLSISAFIFLFMNLFWILPTLFFGGAISETASRGLFGDSLFHIGQSFTIFRWSWTGGYENRNFIVQPIPLYLWAMPLIALGSILFTKNSRKTILYFFIIAILGFFLTKQSDNPFPNVYLWLYNHLPGFNVFREASKFYIITSFAFWGMLLYGLSSPYWKTDRTRNKSILYALVIIILTSVCLINLKPFVTREIGANFASSSVPTDYTIFKNYLEKQSPGRVLWTPLVPTWAYHSDRYPAISSVALMGGAWSNLYNFDVSKMTDFQFATELFDEDRLITPVLFNNASIKYIVVPPRTYENYSDLFFSYGGLQSSDIRDAYIAKLDKLTYLKRINIGTEDLIVYENINSVPFVSVVTHLDENPLNKNFVPNDSPENAFIQSTFKTRDEGNFSSDLFFDVRPDNKSGILSTQINVGQAASLSAKPSTSYSYNIDDSALNLFASSNSSLTLDGNKILSTLQTQNKKPHTINVDLRYKYYLESDGIVSQLDTKRKKGFIGRVNESLAVFRAIDTNLMSNGSFENGLWESKVQDCSPYDDKPHISMKLDGAERTEGSKSLLLTAARHTACTTSSPVKVKGGSTYLLSFDYKVTNADRASFKIITSDAEESILPNDLWTSDSSWHNYQHIVKIPDNSSSFQIQLYGQPDNKLPRTTLTNYDNVTLKEVTNEFLLTPESTSNTLPVSLSPGKHTLTYMDNAYSGNNIVPDASFEDGLWQSQKSTCHRADSPIETKVDNSQKTAGRQSLKLQALGYFVCARSPAFSVDENESYFFSLDYKSPNTDKLKYIFTFNDPPKTVISHRIDFKNSRWNNLTDYIRVPPGASKVDVSLYGSADDYSNQVIELNLDNLYMVKMPDIINTFSVSDQATEKLEKPKEINYTIVNPNRTDIHITQAKQPFILALSQSYSSLWRLGLKGGAINYVSPLAKADYVTDSNHLRINTWENGWLVDPSSLCEKSSPACHKNIDGSYDIDLVAEFTPQRWFYTGLIISSTTLVAFVGYLVYDWRKWKNGKIVHYTSR